MRPRAWLGGGSGGLATDGIQKLLSRNSGCTTFHHHQSAGDVGNVRGFEWRCSASKRQRVRCQNSVARAGDIDGLIAAMNRDLREAIAWLEERSTVPSARNQERLEFHCGKSHPASARELGAIFANDSVMFVFEFRLVWGGRVDSGLRITVKLVPCIERDW